MDFSPNRSHEWMFIFKSLYLHRFILVRWGQLTIMCFYTKNSLIFICDVYVDPATPFFKKSSFFGSTVLIYLGPPRTSQKCIRVKDTCQLIDLAHKIIREINHISPWLQSHRQFPLIGICHPLLQTNIWMDATKSIISRNYTVDNGHKTA